MPKKEGICALTGKHGPFVKCHIFPEALTRHDTPGQPIFQAGERRRPIKRMTSWYDPALVTGEGEAILARYDDWAIKFLRQKRLIWSGWKGHRLAIKDAVELGDGWSGATMLDENWLRLRVFLLSILWRAASTRLPEFSEVVLPSEELDPLRLMVLSGTAEPLDTFPATLVQLTTKGPRHNHTPIAGRKPLDASGPILPREARFFRFFIEGLIVHFERDVRLSGGLASLGPMAVGAGENLVVMTRPFEGSFQQSNLQAMLVEMWSDWPTMRPQVVRALKPHA